MQFRQKPLESAIGEWIADKPGYFRRSARWTMDFYHHRLPRTFRFASLLHFGAKSGLAASAPGLMYFVYGTISAWAAVVASACLLAMHTITSVLDRVTKESSSTKDADQTQAMVRVGELLRMCAPASTEAALRDDMIRSALGIIENYARQVTGSRKGEISVSIALYTGNSSHKMRIRHRNPGNERPIGKEFEGRGVLGHHACQHGAGPKIVHNLLRMHPDLRQSPTNSEVVYRSFLLIPLTIRREDKEKIGGFLSIDSTRPYTFYGKRGKKLVVTCEPVVEHIQKLL